MSDESGTGRTPDDARAGLHAPFRPQAARVVTLGLAVLVALLTAALVAALPSIAPEYGPGDQAGIALLGLAITWFCWRQASVSARPDETGLTIRNLVVSRRLAWAEIVSVRFGGGRPWVQLDLADGDTLAVMGIQRADGARADAEARRLATLVELHSRTARDD
ncbi:PH domain-containing protein [Cellulomonas sp. WB94]|uniref:PH domain-containing protein n=1 Tax=Cellulomonas sp. WB94 TaxID=2173174 RepID=UPI001F5BDF71|nr:PH domain-containing protein [Cellulomonas sp. WB94]